MEPLHIALLPWLAFGHMIPFFHLAVALAGAGIRVSYLCTPRNIRRLPTIPQKVASLITFIELPLPSVDSLPSDAEATVDLSTDDVPLLKIAYDGLRHPVKLFLSDESPDWIIHDFIPYWATTIARDSGVLSVYFSVYSAATMAFLGPPEALAGDGQKRWWPTAESLASKPEWVDFPSTVAFTRREAESVFAAAFDTNASGVTDMNRFRLAIEGCAAVAFRSCDEYEGQYLELLGRLYGKPVLPTGLLPPAPAKMTTGGGGGGELFRWLDGQQARSVVFVSFGSEYKLTQPEVHELAYGLERSELPFLWVLRRPAWVSGDDGEALPEGFIARVRGRGLVSFGWAPQLEILAHPAIGGSLFHSGWGSIIETLQHGHALVVLPTILDQGLNARLLVERGLAVEVERDADGAFNRDEIAKSLKMAMVSEEGERLKMKAREIRGVFDDQGLHERYIEGFINYLRKNRQPRART